MSCPNTTIIANTEYIGNSLVSINNNFSSLKIALCDNQTQIIALQSFLQNLDTILIQLSSQASFGVAKYWVKFSGVLDSNNNLTTTNPDRYLFNSLGVSSVYRKGLGDYRVYFLTPNNTTNYNFSINNKETLISSKYYWAQVYKTEKDYVDIKVKAPDGSLTDPEFVSLIVFS